MGSEQSHQAAGASGERSAFASSRRTGSSEAGQLLSPRQESVCSDSEVPYVSYTVNKPIGESPKKGKTSKYRFSPKLTKRSVSTTDTVVTDGAGNSRRFVGKDSTLVVVNRGNNDSSIQDDPELARLRDIPAFLPIMRASLSSGGGIAKDPDILERLDNRGLMAICRRYEDHLRATASVVSTQQAEICKNIRDVDDRLSKISSILSERQKNYARYADQLKKVGEMSRVLTKCHLLLNENLEQLDVLNNLLPCDQRFEPFVWTTG